MEYYDMPYVCDTLWHVKLAGSTVLYDPILTKKRKKKITATYKSVWSKYKCVCTGVFVGVYRKKGLERYILTTVTSPR